MPRLAGGVPRRVSSRVLPTPSPPAMPNKDEKTGEVWVSSSQVDGTTV